jgi:hypothetical protein
MTTLTLGNFTFEHAEIPSYVNFGGEQMLSVHQLIGGKRIIDSLGASDSTISWSGLFTGIDALNRSQYIDTLRKNGGQLPLTYDNFSYIVMIKSFDAKYMRGYWIPYTITLEVVADLTTPVVVALPAGYLDTIFNLIAAALDIALLVENPSISSALALLNTALVGIPDLLAATSAQIQSLITGAQAVSESIQNAINDIGGG